MHDFTSCWPRTILDFNPLFCNCALSTRLFWGFFLLLVNVAYVEFEPPYLAYTHFLAYILKKCLVATKSFSAYIIKKHLSVTRCFLAYIKDKCLVVARCFLIYNAEKHLVVARHFST